MQAGDDKRWREGRRSRWQSAERRERRGSGKSVRRGEERRKTENGGESCHQSLTHCFCSGYRTELRGRKLMYDSRRTITVLQTRISLIMWKRMGLILPSTTSQCYFPFLGFHIRISGFLNFMGSAVVSVCLCTSATSRLMVRLTGHRRASPSFTWKTLTAPASVWFIFRHILSAILSVVICS